MKAHKAKEVPEGEEDRKQNKRKRENSRMKAQDEGEEDSKRKREDIDLREQLDTLLKLAAVGDAEGAEEFLQKHGNEALNLSNAGGSTPLHVASRGGRLMVVDCFLRYIFRRGPPALLTWIMVIVPGSS